MIRSSPVDALYRIFFLLGWATGDKCCNEAIDVLREKLCNIREFLEIFLDVESIRQYREKIEFIKKIKEGLKLETPKL